MFNLEKTLNSYDEDRIHFMKSRNGSNILWVSFSSRNTENFGFYKTLIDIGENVLFINDNTSSYYNADIPGLCTGPDSLAEIIQGFLSKRYWEKTIFIGSSMGGYAALLFGSIIHPSQVIAFSPQVDIQKPFSLNPQKKLNLTYPDISGLINSNYKTNYTIVTSSHLEDIYHALKITQKENINILILNMCAVDKGHNLLKELADNGFDLTFLFKYLSLGNTDYIPKKDILNNVLTDPDIKQNYCAYLDQIVINKNTGDTTSNFINRLSYKYPQWTQIIDLFSDLLIKEKKYPELALLTSRSLRIKPESYFLYKKLVYAKLASGEFKSAENTLSEANTLNYGKHINLLSMSINLYKDGCAPGAQYSVDKFLSQFPNDYMGLYQQGLIYLSQKNKDSVSFFEKSLSQMTLEGKENDWRFNKAKEHINSELKKLKL